MPADTGFRAASQTQGKAAYEQTAPGQSGGLITMHDGPSQVELEPIACLFLRVAEDTLHVALRAPLHLGADLIVGHRCLQLDGQVDDRDVD